MLKFLIRSVDRRSGEADGRREAGESEGSGGNEKAENTCSKAGRFESDLFVGS